MSPKDRTKQFVILCMARTGSYLLVDLLNQFSDIKCYGEIFKPNRVELPLWAKKKLTTDIKTRDKHPITFIRSLYSLTPRKISGFKMFYFHNEIGKHFVVESPNIRKIILTRSPIDSYFSHQRAKRTDQWTKRLDNKNPKRPPKSEPKLHFDVQEYERHLDRVKEFEHWCSEMEEYTGQSFLWISYEDVVNLEPLRVIAAELGTSDPDAKLAPTMEKQITRPIEELTDNRDELLAYLGKQ